MKLAIRLFRQVLDLALVLLVVVVLAIVLAANVGPGLGHRPVAIRGGSMSPTIPLGALIDVVRTPADQIKAGDVITLKAPNGALVTHRVIRVAARAGGLYFETKGDANQTADPVLEPATAMQGRVGLSLPLLGYLMYLLSIPTGIASVFLFAATLLLSIWLLEELEEEERRDEAEDEGEPVAEPASQGLLGRSLQLIVVPFRFAVRLPRSLVARRRARRQPVRVGE